MNTLFDMEVKKLCHRDDPETSHEAAKKMIESGELNRQEERVWDAIKSYINFNKQVKDVIITDFTPKEICEIIKIGYHVIQRRLSGLHRKGKIERTGQKRNGCAVWKLKGENNV